jgi:hypothetical protein
MKNKTKNARNLQKQEKKSPKKPKSLSANKKLLREEFKNQQKMPTAMGIGVG